MRYQSLRVTKQRQDVHSRRCPTALTAA
jgi:hypothetical protein